MAAGVTLPSFQAHDLRKGHAQIPFESRGRAPFDSVDDCSFQCSVIFFSMYPSLAAVVVKPLGTY